MSSLDGDELRNLQERVEQIEQMTATYGWPLMLDRARHTIGMRSLRVIQGKCETYEEYVHECAFIEGMEYFASLPERINLELERALDDLPPQEDQEEDEIP